VGKYVHFVLKVDEGSNQKKKKVGKYVHFADHGKLLVVVVMMLIKINLEFR